LDSVEEKTDRPCQQRRSMRWTEQPPRLRHHPATAAERHPGCEMPDLSRLRSVEHRDRSRQLPVQAGYLRLLPRGGLGWDWQRSGGACWHRHVAGWLSAMGGRVRSASGSGSPCRRSGCAIVPGADQAL